MTRAQPHHGGRALACASLLAVLSLAGSSTVADATPRSLPVGGMDAHFCADYGEGRGGSWAGVLACNGPDIGAIFFRGARHARIESDTFGFQCVELVDRYLYALKGWKTKLWDGADLVRIYGKAHHVRPVESGNHVGKRPRAGDVISFSVFSNFTDHDHAFPGHVAIVIAADANGLTLLNENWNGGAAVTTLPISGTRIHSILTDSKDHGLVTTKYVEWLPLVIASPKRGYGPFYVTGGTSEGLAVHRLPSATSSVSRYLAKGVATYIKCQVISAAYATQGAPAADSVWDELRGGGYVANFWVSAPDVATLSPGVAHC
jgi:CHAP domain-containing protein